MNAAQQYFLNEALAHARTLPLSDAVLFLRGLLQSCLDSPILDDIRRAYINLSESDRQLELMQIGQWKSNLPDGHKEPK